MSTSVIFNGELLHPSTIPFTAFTRAIRYGDGVFETIPIEAGRAVNLDKYLERLGNGVKTLGLELSGTAQTLFPPFISQLIDANKVTGWGRVRVQVFRQGDGAFVPSVNRASWLIEAEATAAPKTGEMRLMVYPNVRRLQSPLSGIQTSNALLNVLAAKAAQEQGCDDAILLMENRAELVSDTTSASIITAPNFSNNALMIPSIHSANLTGIMRGIVVNRIRTGQSVIFIDEGYLSMQALMAGSREVMVIDDFSGLRPVSFIGNAYSVTSPPIREKTFPGANGDMYKRLKELLK